MTTYTAITNGQIDADSPFDVTLATQYRDNPIAITEGASGAPKIQKAALDVDVVDSTKIDFANCAGMLGTQSQDYTTPYTETGISQYIAANVDYIYIPADATTLHYRVKVATNSGAYYSGARISVASADGTLFQTLSTTETWSGDLTLDISSESGWTAISFDIYLGGGASHGGSLYEWSFYIA